MKTPAKAARISESIHLPNYQIPNGAGRGEWRRNAEKEAADGQLLYIEFDYDSR